MSISHTEIPELSRIWKLKFKDFQKPTVFSRTFNALHDHSRLYTFHLWFYCVCCTLYTLGSNDRSTDVKLSSVYIPVVPIVTVDAVKWLGLIGVSPLSALPT